MAGNVFILLWRQGDLPIPNAIKKSMYYTFILLVLVGIYWSIEGIKDRYGEHTTPTGM